MKTIVTPLSVRKHADGLYITLTVNDYTNNRSGIHAAYVADRVRRLETPETVVLLVAAKIEALGSEAVNYYN